MNITRLITSVAIAMMAVTFTATDASAQQRCDEDQQNEEKGKKNYRTIIGPDGRKIFVIEKAVVVCGKVPRPNVLYAIQASTINYEWQNLKKNFLPKILESVKEAPF